MPKSILTQKQETFCVNYVKTGNATDSAIAAGYSPKTAQVIASENLTKPMIIDRITQLRQPAEAEAILSVVERRQLLAKFAREEVTGKYGVMRDSNLRAIDISNKMDHMYEDDRQPGTVNNIVVIVRYDVDGQQAATGNNNDTPDIELPADSVQNTD